MEADAAQWKSLLSPLLRDDLVSAVALLDRHGSTLFSTAKPNFRLPSSAARNLLLEGEGRELLAALSRIHLSAGEGVEITTTPSLQVMGRTFLIHRCTSTSLFAVGAGRVLGVLAREMRLGILVVVYLARLPTGTPRVALLADLFCARWQHKLLPPQGLHQSEGGS